MIAAVELAGSAAFVVAGDSGCLVVDAGMGRDLRPFERALASLGRSLGDVRLIVATHAHADHCGALAGLKRATGAPLLAHREEAPFIERGRGRPSVAHSRLGRAISSLTAGLRFEACRVDIAAEGELDLAPYGIDGRIVPTPGHSAGSLSVFLDEGAAIVGDLLRGKPGRRGLGPFYEDEAAAIASVARLAGLRPRRVLMAHAAEMGLEELERVAAKLARRGA
jgi:hydroxyacylglutathione hydrolase